MSTAELVLRMTVVIIAGAMVLFGAWLAEKSSWEIPFTGWALMASGALTGICGLSATIPGVS